MDAAAGGTGSAGRAPGGVAACPARLPGREKPGAARGPRAQRWPTAPLPQRPWDAGARRCSAPPPPPPSPAAPLRAGPDHTEGASKPHSLVAHGLEGRF